MPDEAKPVDDGIMTLILRKDGTVNFEMRGTFEAIMTFTKMCEVIKEQIQFTLEKAKQR